VFIEYGPEAGNHLLAGLQQQQRQITMSQGSRMRTHVISPAKACCLDTASCLSLYY
jgi:hypothetical protein